MSTKNEEPNLAASDPEIAALIEKEAHREASSPRRTDQKAEMRSSL